MKEQLCPAQMRNPCPPDWPLFWQNGTSDRGVTVAVLADPQISESVLF